jgi:hypothetical protein
VGETNSTGSQSVEIDPNLMSKFLKRFQLWIRSSTLGESVKKQPNPKPKRIRTLRPGITTQALWEIPPSLLHLNMNAKRK